MKVYFDTNVLLELYLHPKNIVESLLNELNDCFSGDVLIPYRVKFEFKHNRIGYVNQKLSINVVKNIEKEVRDQQYNIVGSIKKLKNIHNIESFNTTYFESLKQYEQSSTNFFSKVFNELDNAKSDFAETYSETDDPILTFVENHFSGVKYSDIELLKLTNIYDTRVKCGIGPGKTDINKKSTPNNRFARAGDYIIWYEILNHCPAGEEIIFVTNEAKEDFWDSDGNFDEFLQKEFRDQNSSSTIEALSFLDFLKKYVFIECEDPIVEAYFDEKRKIYDDIFENKSFVNDCLDEFDDVSYDFLDEHLGDSIEGYNIDSFDEIYIDNVEIVDNNSDIALFYNSCKREIETIFDILISGRVELTADCGHFDGESLESSFSADFERKCTICVYWDYDGENVFLREIGKIDERSFGLKNIINHEFDGDYNKGETCVDCGQPIDYDNYGDGTRCRQCMIKHDDESDD